MSTESKANFGDDTVFRLSAGVRIRAITGGVRAAHGVARVLLAPEQLFLLEHSEAAILALCQGEVPFRRMVDILGRHFEEEVTPDFSESIRDYLQKLLEEQLIVAGAPAVVQPASPADYLSQLDQLGAEYSPGPEGEPAGLPLPELLLAELTHRCPLHCPYCSNPQELIRGTQELTTQEWIRVLEEAAALGVFHVGFSGGEPLLRRDLPALVAAARAAGLYTNLITSGLGWTRDRALELVHAGLDSIQISFQADEPGLGDEVAGATAHLAKVAAARLVRELGVPLSLNVVLHRRNLDRLEQIIALAHDLGARQLELANVQFYGWAFANRDQLLPTRTQVEAAFQTAAAARERLRRTMEIIYVLPDYFGTLPKPCMQGWGRKYLTVNPRGDVLPCPTAGAIPGLQFENVREHSLAAIWNSSEAFNRFRGTDWMPEPCRSCDRRFEDFGGCRCQAALIAGNAAFTDPACFKSPYRKKLAEIIDRQSHTLTGAPSPFTYRHFR
jgi:pyrroloquinoline quinone biosynthesis protein E